MTDGLVHAKIRDQVRLAPSLRTNWAVAFEVIAIACGLNKRRAEPCQQTFYGVRVNILRGHTNVRLVGLVLTNRWPMICLEMWVGQRLAGGNQLAKACV